jgi:hypothetical protein
MCGRSITSARVLDNKRRFWLTLGDNIRLILLILADNQLTL